jgi:hypothetical protein
MKLPNHDRATVPMAKVVDYLLSDTHPIGRHKAAFFKRFGYSEVDWTIMAAALARHAADHDLAQVEDTPFGTRYVVEGIMATPAGRSPLVRTIWFLDTGADAPRFVTAYPLEAAE